MKKKAKIFITCITSVVLIFCLALPCFGAISDIKDSLVIEELVYSANSSYSPQKLLIKHEYAYGDTVHENHSFLNSTIIPNYFTRELKIYSSSGLPVTDKKVNYSFTVSNLYDFISTDEYGEQYLKSIDQIRIAFFYSDGTVKGYSLLEDYEFGYSDLTKNYYVGFEVYEPKPVIRINLLMYFNISNFNMPFFTSSSNLSNVIYYIGANKFDIVRNEVFPGADSGNFDMAEQFENEVVSDSEGGLNEGKDVLNSVGSILSPGQSVYKGTLFLGSLLRDLTIKLPDLYDILYISLALGLVMVILGSVLFTVGNSKGNSVKKGKGDSVKKGKGD